VRLSHEVVATEAIHRKGTIVVDQKTQLRNVPYFDLQAFSRFLSTVLPLAISQHAIPYLATAHRLTAEYFHVDNVDPTRPMGADHLRQEACLRRHPSENNQGFLKRFVLPHFVFPLGFIHSLTYACGRLQMRTVVRVPSTSSPMHIIQST
jgi:hypothetical protein